MLNKLNRALVVGCLLANTCAFALPTEITFSNNTSLDLATSVAGIPGNGVAPNVTRAVSYSIVSFGCYMTGNMENCPIEFTNKDSGEHVATVYINANSATLNQAPIFYGTYGTSYEVTGWENGPISHISINKK